MNNSIIIEKPGEGRLKNMGVEDWPIWEKEVSSFSWSYDERETCYILEGRAKVRSENGEEVEFGPGDMVIFPAGMNCVWDITTPIKKHYKFG
jgi:uncharacterized protein